MNLPTSWQAAKIYQIIDDIVGGGTPSKTNPENFKGNIPFMTVKDMRGRLITDTIDKISEDALQNSAATLVPPDTLVIATRMALGKISKTTQATAINQDIKAIYPSNGVEKSYIEHFWRYRAQYIDSIGTGTTVKGIRLEDIRSLSIPIAPSNEQRRIADKLDRVLACVDVANEHLSRVAPLIKRFRQSVLAAATSGRLTEDWRGKETNWNTATIGQVLADIRYGTAKKCSYDPKGTAVLRIPNIGNHGRIELSDLKYAEFTQKEYESFALQPGDLLLIRSNGSVDLVGKTSVVDKASAGLLFAGYLMRLRIQEDIALPSYIQFALSSPEQRHRVESIARSTSGVNNINTEEVRSLPFHLPPIDEQSEIVRRVERLFAFADRLEERLTQAQAAVQKLTPALLAKAFRGELVPQDPNDEPASELLKRLQENRADNAQPGRARKPHARKSP